MSRPLDTVGGMADPGVSLAATTQPPVADLVLEGGGVKGIALAGAIQPLVEAGYTFARVGGSSAGALVGAVVAAMQQRGEPLGRLVDIATTLDYRKFRDRGFPGRYLGPLGFLGDAVSLLAHDGAYRGDYLKNWLEGVLKEFGVETFGDLRVDDPGSDGEMHHRYRLVVTASDVSRHRLLQLPWDYETLGLPPDEQRVVDAVRASASIPYFFEPVQLRHAQGTSTLVDGGLVSNYPIDMFDRQDGRQPRWPTIGVRLDALNLSQNTPATPIHTPATMGIALIVTAIEACQAEHVLTPCNLRRSIFVDTDVVSAIDFDISKAQQQELLQAGRAAAEDFLRTWSYDAWLSECRGGAHA